MKKTKNLSRTLAVIAFVVFALQLIIGIFLVDSGDAADASLAAIGSLPMILGVAFIFAENKVVEKVGFGLLLVVAIGSLSAVTGGETLSLIFGIIIFALLIVSVLTFFVRAVLLYFGYAKSEIFLRENALASSLKRIKDLAEKQVISQEQHGVLKAKLLDKNLSGAEKSSLDQKVVLLEKGLIDVEDVL